MTADSRYFEIFQTAGDVRIVGLLELDVPDSDLQKRLFETGKVLNPELRYTSIDIALLEEKESDLFNLRTLIVQDLSLSIEMRKAYTLAIDETLASIWFLMATHADDMTKVFKYSEYLYGRPTDEGWTYTCNDLHSLINRGLQCENVNANKAASLLQKLINLKPFEVTRIPSEELMKEMSQVTLNEIEHILPDLDPYKRYEVPEIVEVFETALSKLNLTDWSVITDPKKISISVIVSEKKVVVPTERTAIRGLGLRGLVAHEIGTHVLRAVRGSSSCLGLLARGLDRYTAAEEGVAKLRESIARGEMISHPEGLNGHLAVCLALGIDGKPRNFNECYAVLLEFFRLENYLEGNEPENAEKQAKQFAWDWAYRTFRGTNGRQRGVCLTKDAIYREGSIALVKTLEKDLSLIHYLSVGKFDPGNAEHLTLLRSLGIIPQI